MPVSVPVPTKNPGDVLTSALWNSYLRDNINKLLNQGHRVLTVAQFGALTGLEGTKGTVAPDEVYLEVDSTNGIEWHLAYESGEPTYKWRFLGGPPMVAVVETAENTASATSIDLTTVGPSITLPRGGDYDIETKANVTNVSGTTTIAGLTLNVSAATLANSGVNANPGAAGGASVFGKQRPTGNAASATAKIQYSVGAGGGTAQFGQRRLFVTPVRLI